MTSTVTPGGPPATETRRLGRAFPRRTVTAPGRGRGGWGTRITVTGVSAEPLSGSAKLYVTQTGLSTYILTMTRVDSRTFRATFTLKTGGSAGSVTFKVWAKDYDGRSQATIKRLPLG